MDYETDRGRMDMSHHVILEQREQLVVSGVEEVERFDESSILLTTVQDGGDLKVEGRVNALIYETEEGRRGGLFARLLGG